MTMRLYSIFDAKADFFGNPFTCRNAGEASRAFHQASEDPQTQINKYAEDFVLYELGGFDPSTGKLTPNETPLNLGSATQYKREIQ